MKADIILLATGFTQPFHDELLQNLGIKYNKTGKVEVSEDCCTNLPGVFAVGDVASGPSLVVRAINSGREAATKVDKFLRQ